MTVVDTFLVLFTLIPATVMVLVGRRLRRRSAAVPRVAVEAFVVHLTRAATP